MLIKFGFETHFYRPQTKLLEGNDFTLEDLSFCSQGRGVQCVSGEGHACMGGGVHAWGHAW